MSLIGKEILPFKAQAYNSGTGEFIEVTDENLNGALFASTLQTSHSFAQLNLATFKTNMQR